MSTIHGYALFFFIFLAVYHQISKSTDMKRLITLNTMILFLIIDSQNLAAQCLNCGDGSNGPYNATTNTTLAGGTYNFTTFYIAPGVTVNVTGASALVIQCTG